MDVPEDPHLRALTEVIEELRWAALVVDADFVLRAMTSELRWFTGVGSDQDPGIDRTLADVFATEPWARTMAEASWEAVVRDLAPFLLGEAAHRGLPLDDVVPAPLVGLARAVDPVAPPDVWWTRFAYIAPNADEEVADYDVDIFFQRQRGDDGRTVGWLLLFQMAVRPGLLSLLARGDEDMYERMARLVEPSSHAAAILFCDLAGSGVLSRHLSSAAYFRLVRTLWSAIDAAVAAERGIVGKHAGDGATAFFLVDDLGSPSAAAAAAVRTSRAIHDVSEGVFRQAAGTDCLMKVGLHWGGALYMGQLVPGGRLDITALGDEVNEAARIQETAAPHQTLASKQLLERLDAVDAAGLGIDPGTMTYELLADLAPDAPKVVRDAGALAVAALEHRR